MLRLWLLMLGAVQCRAEEKGWQVVTERVCSGSMTEFSSCGKDVPPCERSCIPKNCTFGDWADWSVPLMGCEGLCTRERTITEQNNDCGKPCSGPSSDTKQCPSSSKDCTRAKQDCVLNVWGAWDDSACKGNPLGQQMRERMKPYVLNASLNGGAACNGNLTQTKPCAEPVSSPCDVQEWSDWSTCTKTCGRGLMNRTREYTQMVHSGTLCTASLKQQTVCSDAPCGSMTDCKLSPWGDWSKDCSEWNVQERSRSIVKATAGGAPCIRAATNESRQCDPSPQKDCVWNPWMDWTACTSSCDGGQRSRERTFVDPQNGGLCTGDTSAIEACGTEPCITGGERDCQLGKWSDWSECSVSCGRGFTTRKIKNYTKMKNGGESCAGSMQSAKQCTMPACQEVDCVWEDWAEWGGCTASCGGGKTTRTRAIKSHPMNGGEACASTTTTEVVGCNLNSCKEKCIDGTWAPWGAWGNCSATCGSGYRSRSRAAATQPNECGFPADGARVEFSSCSSLPECSTDQDCKLGHWSDWAACTATCFGVKFKYRAIELFAKGNGKQCNLSALTLATPCNPGKGEAASDACSKANMVTDCELSDWKEWDHCSATCGGGQKKRFRTIKTPPQNGGKTCGHTLAETTGCNMTACGSDQCVDCQLNTWQEWGGCKSGQSYRTRSVHSLPNDCGKKCTSQVLEETRPCTVATKWVSFCAWSEWQAWPTCKPDACPSDEIRRQRTLAYSRTATEYLFKSHQKSSLCYGTQTQTKQCPDVSKCKKSSCLPVDCELDAWSEWIQKTEGEGLCSRSRGIKQENTDCGKPCGLHNTIQTKACAPSSEKVDCKLTEWDEWTTCATPESLRYRSREWKGGPANGGKPCQDAIAETQSCYALTPAVDCEWTDWTAWGACQLSGDKTCGSGYHKRHRSTKKQATFGGKPCNGPLSQVEKCQGQSCSAVNTTNCKLEAWSAWSTCQSDLQMVRTRKIKTETNNGLPCAGGLQDTKGCALNATDCELSTWSSWTACYPACAGGRSTRFRNITTYPKNAGKECVGTELLQSQGCNHDVACEAQKDCEFGLWSAWGACSVSCGYAGEGQQTRDRTYSARKLDGDGCVGQTSEIRACQALPMCNKTDCEWDNWTEWSDCTSTCGPGQSNRHRRIAKAPLGIDAKTCNVSSMTETKACYKPACNPISCTDGEWADWEDWEACTATCGKGVTFRSRKVAKQASICGKPATGKSSQFASCESSKMCPEKKDCTFGEWSEWDACTSTCDGVHRRSRTMNQSAVGNGKECDDKSEEIAPCENSVNAEGCPVAGIPIDCVFNAWSEWTPCPVTCGGGQQHSQRTVKEYARNGGKACDSPDLESGTTFKTKGCAESTPCEKAPEVNDCKWSDWADWSVCNICGGERYRQRSIAVQPTYGGAPCVHTDAEEIGSCPTTCNDIIVCEWSDWGEWGDCSVTCKSTLTGKDSGRRHRKRDLKANITKPDAKRLYEDGDSDLEVQELYRRAKKAEARRWEEVSAAFIVGCLSLLAVAAGVKGCGRLTRTQTQTKSRRLTSTVQGGAQSRNLAAVSEEEDYREDMEGSAME